MQIRRASHEDIQQIAKLWRELDDYNMNKLKQFKVFRNGAVGGIARYIKKLNLMFRDEDCITLVADDENKIVGFVTCFISDTYGNGKEDAYIDVTVITEEHRGKGMGRKLYEYLEEILKARKVTGITTDVFDNNDSSLKFHEKMGFEKIASAVELYKKL